MRYRSVTAAVDQAADLVVPLRNNQVREPGVALVRTRLVAATSWWGALQLAPRVESGFALNPVAKGAGLITITRFTCSEDLFANETGAVFGYRFGCVVLMS